MTPPDLEARLTKSLSIIDSDTSDFDLNPDVQLPESRKLTPAAVLMCFRPSGSVILTKRSAKLKHHPGQIALPGGKKDPEDLSLTATALREAEEEIGLPANKVRILGTLPNHETVTGFSVTPVIGLIDESFAVVPEIGEVSEVFDVPISHVIDPKNFLVQSRMWQGQPRYYYTVPYGPYYIWGATARMFRNLSDGFAS